MSSPHVYSRTVSPGPTPASASTSNAGGGGDTGMGNGVSVRSMRLKVLYTFDDENKTNCLARWPHAISVQVVHVDETTPIGIIELKTCVTAIVAASPELVAKLGKDYTVYAYDYSEYETPLVGQGMLSWALASASSNPATPAMQSRSLITGRVCTNILGIFSNGIRETLEVKLRLVPVPTCLQSEYISSMEKYRELSRVIPKDFDASAWTTYLQTNPDVGQLANRLAAQVSCDRPESREGSGQELVSQLLSQGLLSGNTDQSNGSTQYQMAAPDRLSTPEGNTDMRRKMSFGSAFQSTSQEDMSCSSSWMGSRRPSFDSQASVPMQREMVGLEENAANSGQEEGPPKKRARTTKATRVGKVSLASQPSSLRVAASTAASIRVVRPIAINPSSAGQNSLQELPRAPTPRPESTNGNQQRTRPTARSLLAHESSEPHRTDPGYFSQPSESIRRSVEISMMSPEDCRNGSASNTPLNIASSPPVMTSPTPSSPGLPMLHREESHATRTSIDDLFGDDEDREDAEEENPSHEDRQVQAPPPKELFIQECTPGPRELLPTKMLPRPPSSRIPRRAMSVAMSDAAESPEENQQAPPIKQKALPPKALGPPPPGLPKLQPKPRVHNTIQPLSPSRSMSRTTSVGSLTLPQISSSEPVQPPNHLCRSQTWTSGQQQPTDLASEGQAPPKTANVDAPKARSGSKRKQAIQAKLMVAIQTGEIPPYCGNCGQIETPTWRKAWTKIFERVDSQRLVSENEGGPIMAVEELQKDESGNAIATQVVKKSLIEGVDVGFTEILLCNPCGLWLNKFKNMRPRSQWEKDGTKKPPAKRNRAGKRKKNPLTEEASELNFQSEAEIPKEDGSHEKKTSNELQAGGVETSVSDLPPLKRQRAQSTGEAKSADERHEFWDVTAPAALRRAIQSSPARFLGTRNSPIDLENMGSTRRLLFPSPRKENTPKKLHRYQSVNSRSSSGKSDRDTESDEGHGTYQSDDKENRPPREHSDDDDEITKLFEQELEKRPSTPTNADSSPLWPLKTPTRFTPLRNGLTSSPWRSFNFSPRGTDGVLLPSTPNRSSLPVNGGEETPFSRHLTQLLSEAHTFDILSPSNDGHDTSFQLPDFDGDGMLLTDAPMPSSPPLFHLYEDPGEASSGLWSDFNGPNSPNADELINSYGLGLTGEEVVARAVQIAGSEGVQGNGALTVDFSAYLQTVGNGQGKESGNQPPDTAESQVV